jgi:hypothetical protein
VPTPSGTETITYVEELTPSGTWTTHVSEPTAHGGVVSYEETVTTARSPSGAIVSYVTETNSAGEVSSYTESAEMVCRKVTHVDETTVHGGTKDITYSTVVTPAGGVTTYVESTTSDGSV